MTTSRSSLEDEEESIASSLTPEWYHEKIETLAPQSRDVQSIRCELYRELREGSDIRQIPPVPPETELHILGIIWTYLNNRSRHREKYQRAVKVELHWYLKERKRLMNGPLEKGWEGLLNHPLVWEVEWRPPNRRRILFYPLPMAYCPHGR